MKQIVTIVVVLALAAAGIGYVGWRKGKTVRDAVAAEQMRTYPQALALYASALLELAETVPMTDRSPEKARVYSAELWDSEIRGYVARVRSPGSRRNASLRSVMDGMARCTSQVTDVNQVRVTGTVPCSLGLFVEKWKELFYPPDVSMPPSQTAFATAAFNDNLSVLTLSAPPTYHYEIDVVDPHSAVRRSLVMYPESKASFVVRPGSCLLFCVSTVTFPSGEIWRSPVSVAAVEVPGVSSLIAASYKTEVNRDR